MKKVKLTGKLSLNKETVAKLNNSQMNQVNGGGGSINHASCSGCDTVFTCPETYTCPPPASLVACETLNVFCASIPPNC